MAEQSRNEIRPGQAGDLSAGFETTPDDLDNDSDVERVEVLAAGVEDKRDIEADGLGEKLAELAATTEEEVDALRVNLLQDDEPPGTRDSSGRVVDDTSRVLRRHHHNTTIARSDAVVGGNLDEPMDESIAKRKVDEGTSG